MHLQGTPQACFCQPDLAHFDHLIWPTVSA
jgi:hypothetical protein